MEGDEGNGKVDDEVNDDESELEEENNNEFAQEKDNGLHEVENQYEFKEKDQKICIKGKKKRSFFYKLSEAKKEMVKLKLLEKVDVTIKLLMTHELNPEEVGVSISAEDARNHLKLMFSKLSTFQLRERSRNILSILLSHQESALLLRHLLRDTVFQEEQISTMLRCAGVKLEDSFLTREELACKVARVEGIKLTSHRRGPDREVATRLAVSVVKLAGLQESTHGDQAILIRALGLVPFYFKFLCILCNVHYNHTLLCTIP